MPWQRPPRTNHLEDPEFHWPAWKVGLRIEDLFGDLHERFNTAPMFIQDPNAFHHDVADIADRASNKADFYARLQERRDERLAELLKMMEYLDAFDLRRHFDQLSEFQRARYFLRRNASLDSLIAFIASFLGPNKSGELPSVDKLLSSESLKKKYGHFLQDVPTTESTISAQTQPHESPGRLPGPASADESELTDRELDDGEQMLGFMKVKRKRKRKRSNKVIDELRIRKQETLLLDGKALRIKTARTDGNILKKHHRSTLVHFNSPVLNNSLLQPPRHRV